MNKSIKGNKNGAGNPNNDGIKTDYLWKEILTKARLTNILQSFAQFIEEEKEYIDDKGKTQIRKERKLIFPRYHQLTAVRELLTHAKEHGAGQKYLIQHSAGSGKSNSISWLAHQLVSLHDKGGTQNVFDSVIVVTDRKVLDAQIQANVRQFEQVAKLVQPITEGSKQLKEALEEGKKIIITTIQKFPRIVEDIGELPGNRFAIIIDEAHSSLSGQMARQLNATLSKVTDEDELKDHLSDYNDDENDEVNPLLVHVGNVDTTVRSALNINRAKPRIIRFQHSFNVFGLKSRLQRNDVGHNNLALEGLDSEQSSAIAFRQNAFFVDDEVVSKSSHATVLNVLEETECIWI